MVFVFATTHGEKEIVDFHRLQPDQELEEFWPAERWAALDKPLKDVFTDKYGVCISTQPIFFFFNANS